MSRLRLVVGFWLALTGGALAQSDWPTRPVTIVLPAPAGGSVDIVTRAVAEELSAKLGQRFVVENRMGANGAIGAAAVAKAPADGYTLLMAASGALVLNTYLYKDLAYDPAKAFAPIILVGHTPLYIVASKKMSVTDFKGLIAYAKANPGKVNAGTFGVGSQGHITVGLINKLTGASITHVPYRDYSKMLPGLLSGELQITLIYMPAMVPQVQSGELLGLAVASQGRSKTVPNVPSVTELGYADLVSPGWFALSAPAGTPNEIVAKVNKIVNNYLNSDAAAKLLETAAMMPGGGTADELAGYLKSEHQKWGPIIKEANITLQ